MRYESAEACRVSKYTFIQQKRIGFSNSYFIEWAGSGRPIMMTKEGSTKLVNFMTPGAGVLMLWRGHISHYSEYVLSSPLSIYSTDCYCVKRDYDAAFLYHHWFLFILYGAVDIQIILWALLTRSQCVSDTRVTVKACWPLVHIYSISMMSLLIIMQIESFWRCSVILRWPLRPFSWHPHFHPIFWSISNKTIWNG